MLYLVTVKLPKNREHNPRDKKTGQCPLSIENTVCTDQTGEHHTVLVKSNLSLGQIMNQWQLNYHVTRIEVATIVHMEGEDGF